MKVELRNIRKYYQDYCVFENLNTNFSSNLIHIIGENGAGKSTLLKILSANTEYDGSIFIDNIKQSKDDLQRNVILANQDIILLENYTVRKNLSISGVKKNKYIDQYLDSSLLELKVNELSGGQKKFLSLIIAFALEPSMILLDEFSNFLDDEHLEKIKEAILEYSKTHMVIYVDHNVSLEGEKLNLENPQSFSSKENGAVLFKKRKFKPSSYYFLSQYSILPFASFLIYFMLYIALLFITNILIANPYEIAASYYLDNNFTYVPLNASEQNKDLILYYGVELTDKEKIELTPFYSVTYCTEFNFSLAKEIEEKEGYKPCFVFEIDYEVLGKTFTYDGEKYYVKGIIDYPYSKDSTISTLSTFFVIGEKPEEKDIFTLFTNFNDDLKLVEYFKAKKVYLENSGFLSAINQNLKKDVYQILLIITILITLFFYGFAGVIQMKIDKNKLLFLRQYGKSELELSISKILGEIPKFILIGLLGYFLTAYLLNIYEKNIIFPWRTMLIPSLLLTILLLIINFLLMLVLQYIVWKKYNKNL